MPTRIFLIGFMGSGKTTHGRKIARMMDYDFVDMDEWIEEQEGRSVTEIFRDNGESWFREKERMAIHALSKLEKIVISTGGGVPCHGNNMELLKASGLTVYIKLPAEALVSRLTGAKSTRPLLEGKSPMEIRQTIHTMLTEREPFYQQAHMTIDGLGRVNERVVNAIQRNN